MTPGAHLLSSWILAETAVPTCRERRLISLVGVIPDVDGLGLVVDLITGDRTEYYATFHHLLAHNLLFGLAVSFLAALFIRSHKLRLFTLSLCVYHVHLLCDLVGSKGPDGDLWPLHYLYPFAPDVEVAWRGQWLLNGWQNLLFLMILFAGVIFYAMKRRRSFIEVISHDLDRQIFLAIGKRWPA